LGFSCKSSNTLFLIASFSVSHSSPAKNFSLVIAITQHKVIYAFKTLALTRSQVYFDLTKHKVLFSHLICIQPLKLYLLPTCFQPNSFREYIELKLKIRDEKFEKIVQKDIKDEDALHQG
jgi:hypothetical protein